MMEKEKQQKLRKQMFEGKRKMKFVNDCSHFRLCRIMHIDFSDGGVKECLQLGGSGEEESGHKGRMVSHRLS